MSKAGSLAILKGQNFAAESREGGGRGWARVLYLVSPSEETGRVNVGVRLVLIIRHFDVVPHAVVHHLASVGQPATILKGVAAAKALESRPAESRPAESRPFRFRPGARAPPLRDVTFLVTVAAAVATKLVLKAPARAFRPAVVPTETAPHLTRGSR